MEWFEWAGEEIRCAKELEEVRARSTKRRKTRAELTINVQDEHSPPVVGAPPAEHAQMTARSTQELARTTSEIVAHRVSHPASTPAGKAQTAPNSLAPRSPLK